MRNRLLICAFACAFGLLGQTAGSEGAKSPNLNKPGSDHPMPLPKATPDAPPAARGSKPDKSEKKQTRSRKSDDSKPHSTKQPNTTR